MQNTWIFLDMYFSMTMASTLEQKWHKIQINFHVSHKTIQNTES